MSKKLLMSLQRVPRVYLLGAVPIVAFLVSFGVALGLSGDETTPIVTRPADTLSIENLDQPPTPLPGADVVSAVDVAPTETPITNRRDCDAIEGNEYLSSEEHSWYLENCLPTEDNTAQSAADTSPPARVSVPAVVGTNEYVLGDRLVIPSIGVDTTVNGSVVGGDGQMVTPVGYFNALWYDFKAYSGIGGYVDEGNLVLAGHVDCASCINSGPGAAIFYNVRNLRPGDTIQYSTADGQTVNYVVTSSEWYLPTDNWSTILASGAADLSIITCIGNFDSSRREYTNRLVVYAQKT